MTAYLVVTWRAAPTEVMSWRAVTRNVTEVPPMSRIAVTAAVLTASS